MEEIQLTITKEDAQRFAFSNIHNCPFARAVKRALGLPVNDKDISVGTDVVKLYDSSTYQWLEIGHTTEPFGSVDYEMLKTVKTQESMTRTLVLDRSRSEIL